MTEGGIQFFNRYTGLVEMEAIYGEKWLRWTLYNPFGRMSMHAVAKCAWFSRWYGRSMTTTDSATRIRPFIERYDIDDSEFAEPPEKFKSFNEFFYRKLKSHARQVHGDKDTVVFPADGRHLGFSDLSRVNGVFVKGQHFDLECLVGVDLAERYHEGSAVLSRLCPVDYHRFHFPCAGMPAEARLVEGALWSVNPLALRVRLANLWYNRRFITELETERLGKVLILEIGATNVGSVNQNYKPSKLVVKGAEKGYFAFGGSAVLVLFEPDQVKLDDDLLEQSSQQRELYAHVGDRMGAEI